MRKNTPYAENMVPEAWSQVQKAFGVEWKKKSHKTELKHASINDKMDKNTCPVAKSNNWCPFEMTKKSVHPPGLSHESNTCG